MGSDPEKLFPFEALLDQIRKFAIYSVYVGALYIPIICADVESMPNFDDLSENENTMDGIFIVSDKGKNSYNKKIVDLFDELARLGCI